MQQIHDRKPSPLQWLVIVIVLLLLVPALPFIAVGYGAFLLYIHLKLRSFCAPHGHRVLFVYSNSPNWKDYCESEVLPALPETAVVLNWSERTEWPRGAFSSRLFRTYAGQREFNPIGIVLRPFKRTAIFRFWKPFRDAKHGRPHELERLKKQFLAVARGQD